MTSLIFGTIYLTHQAVTHHRHEKKRVKNYERWEGLRDEYDEQRKTQRASRSLDIQRTGQQPWDDNDRPILTLRDQQEANDARTSWRPQEAWDDAPVPQRPQRQSLDVAQSYYEPRPPQARPQEHRSTSLANGYNANNNSTPALAPQQTGYHGVGPMRATPTGANWDDGLPRPLAVQRTNYGDQPPSSRGVSRSTSLRQVSSAASSQQNLPTSNDTSPPLQSSSLSNSQQLERSNINNPFEAGNRFDSAQHAQPSPTMQQKFEPGLPPSNNPFEQNNRFDQQQRQSPPFQQGSQPPSNNPFEAGNRFDQPRTNNPFEGFAGGAPPVGGMAPIKEMKTPAGEKDMMEWWRQ